MAYNDDGCILPKLAIRFKVGHKMEIITFGVGRRLMRCASELSLFSGECKYDRLILLPIPSTRDKVNVSGTELSLREAVSSADEGTLVAGYGLPKDICDEVIGRGASVYDAERDEDFLEENAVVTAHGTLGHILSNYSEDIADLRIGIIGYGRIGAALLRLLLFIGADVRVYTTRSSVAESLGEMGVCCEVIYKGCDFAENDLIINTAPAKIIDEKSVTEELSGIEIIDLASGKIFPSAPNVTKLASVPDKMYPETAGRIYAKYILRALSSGVKR